MVYDKNNHMLAYSSAQTPIWLIRNGTLLELETDTFILGTNTKKNSACTLFSYKLLKGDIIFSCTDGYLNQLGGEGGLLRHTAEIQSLFLAYSVDFELFAASIEKAFDECRLERPLTDDVTALAFCVA
jgi:hypothetical protein